MVLHSIDKPNLFVVGAAKSGTTYIYDFLDLQSDIYMSPIKEPHYFSKDINKNNFNNTYKNRNNFNIENYLKTNFQEKKHIAYIENFKHYIKLFRDSNDCSILGEASTGYLYSKEAAKEIYKFNPDSKVVIILRDPVERALSHWLMDYRLGLSRTHKCFEDILFDYDLGDNLWGGKSHTYIQIGLYFKQIKRFLDIFPEKQIKIILFEDLKNNTSNVLDDLFIFLGLNKKDKVLLNKNSNKGKVPKNRMSNFLFKISNKLIFIKNLLPIGLLNRIKSLLLTENFSKNEYLSKNEKKYLFNLFKKDITKVESLIKRDLSSWYH